MWDCGLYNRGHRRQPVDGSMLCLLCGLKHFSPGLRFPCQLGKWTQVSGVSPPPSYVRLQSFTVDQDSPFVESRGSCPLTLLFTVVIYREHFLKGSSGDTPECISWHLYHCVVHYPGLAEWIELDLIRLVEGTWGMREETPWAKPKVQHIVQNKSLFSQTSGLNTKKGERVLYIKISWENTTANANKGLGLI